MITLERVKLLAKKRGLTLKQVAEGSGIGEFTIYKWKTSNPKAETLSKIAKLLGTTSDYLLGNTDNPNKPNEENPITELTDESRILSFDGKELTEEDREIINDVLMARRLRNKKNK